MLNFSNAKQDIPTIDRALINLMVNYSVSFAFKLTWQADNINKTFYIFFLNYSIYSSKAINETFTNKLDRHLHVEKNKCCSLPCISK